ncbi:hypothetical protein ADIARSV_0517 [Arcticibacter svalbardensis MN12-7]|uniref:Uncharacterized protein n=1 Tax=Arcticibacter svalbardensis MN12-7 TaxID=1150600 RepID=R9GWU7_9SPHI|nr:hypothetical protein [Arcticibacter svalbardensis]EOR96282.1 hypothetical protein ADIARSV_0517 [Arcticibacter svalbardensis MN12-7]
MKQTINNLHQFIHLITEQALLELPAGKQGSITIAFISECQVLKSKLSQIYFDYDQAAANAFIKSIQIELTQLADHLYGFNAAEWILDSQSVSKEVFKKLTHEIISLLLFLKANFSESFNTQLQAPAGLKHHMQTDIAEKREIILKFLKAGQIDDDLIDIITHYLFSIEGDPEYILSSWRDFDYLENFLNSLLVIQGLKSSESVFLKLVRQVYFMNFNAIQFYDYSRNWLDVMIQRHDTFVEQRRELLLILRDVKQFVELPELAFNPDLPSLKQMVCTYIEEEMEYLQKTETLHEGPYHNKGRNAYPFYFHVKFTTAQLMFFTRLLVESGFIITKRKADLHEFISNHIGTLRKDNLSGHSIKNKQYTPSKEVVHKVKDFLLMLISLIHEKYNFRD